jgi:hypothetical protein
MPAKTDRDATRPYRVLFVLFALALAGRITYTIDAIGDMRHRYPARPVTLGSPWPSIVGLHDNARAAGLQVGDRVIAIDGRAQEGLSDPYIEVRRKNPGDEMVFSIDRDAPAVAQLRSSRAPVVMAEGNAGGAGLERLDAQLLLPLASNKELLGFISLGPKKSEVPYSASDTNLLHTVAAQTGMALENSRLTEAIASEMAQRELLRREIEIAREVQQRLFPQTMPEAPALQYAGHCRPARGVGGDYYDFLALTGGSLGIAIGDVSGKGHPAALLMASLAGLGTRPIAYARQGCRRTYGQREPAGVRCFAEQSLCDVFLRAVRAGHAQAGLYQRRPQSARGVARRGCDAA